MNLLKKKHFICMILRTSSNYTSAVHKNTYYKTGGQVQHVCGKKVMPYPDPKIREGPGGGRGPGAVSKKNFGLKIKGGSPGSATVKETEKGWEKYFDATSRGEWECLGRCRLC